MQHCEAWLGSAAFSSLKNSLLDVLEFSSPSPFASSSTARFLVPVQVTGTGTFAIYVGDAAEPAATATAAAGATELRLAVPASATARFVYEPGANDTGAAILGALANASGMTVIFR